MVESAGAMIVLTIMRLKPVAERTSVTAHLRERVQSLGLSISKFGSKATRKGSENLFGSGVAVAISMSGVVDGIGAMASEGRMGKFIVAIVDEMGFWSTISMRNAILLCLSRHIESTRAYQIETGAWSEGAAKECNACSAYQIRHPPELRKHSMYSDWNAYSGDSLLTHPQHDVAKLLVSYP
jgi:hypothetical protein